MEARRIPALGSAASLDGSHGSVYMSHRMGRDCSVRVPPCLAQSEASRLLSLSLQGRLRQGGADVHGVKDAPHTLVPDKQDPEEKLQPQLYLSSHTLTERSHVTAAVVVGLS